MLDVYLHRELVGRLNQRERGDMAFQYGESWLSRPEAVALSQSLPLRKERFRPKECHGYFGGLLPDGDQRRTTASIFGISTGNDYAMLEKIGGECAGAVTFIPAGQPLPEFEDRYRKLSGEELAEILKKLPQRPLLAGEAGIRLSLAGAQDKIAVRIADGKMYLPLDGSPSTHIIKPAVKGLEGVVFNEALCLKLARASGLPAANVETRSVENIDYLLVERYDRIHQDGLKRLHQEDFCQALGIAPEQKYQKEGGPSLKQCFALLREVSSAPAIDLARLLDAVIFNYIVGNNDAHGKNFSLLYHGEGKRRGVRLAPLYDVVSTMHYPDLSQEMAMRLGGEYSSERVTLKNFDQLAQDAMLGKAQVRIRVGEVAKRMIEALGKMDVSHPTARAVAEAIRPRAERAL